MAAEGSQLKISFRVRKVTIQRPWMDPAILHYPILGIKGLESSAWWTGEMDSHTNEGSFPLLPTAMIVAKDIKIHAASFSDPVSEKFSEMSVHASAKVNCCPNLVAFVENSHPSTFLLKYIIPCSIQVSIGPFSAGGNFSHAHGSKNSKSTYNALEKSIEIPGAQIIGWVCVVNPLFPHIDSK